MLNDLYHMLDPVAISAGPITIYWYGLAYVVGALLTAVVMYRTQRRWGFDITVDDLTSVVVGVVFGLIIGARLFYVIFYGDGYYWAHPLEIFATNEGGMSFHGGLVGGIIGGVLVCRMYKLDAWTLADLAVIGAPLALCYKAVNTMDSMLGYVEPPYKNIGLVPAKADDVVNYIPARLSALLMLTAGGLMGLDISAGWRIFRRDHRKHASPNSAQTESVCAGLLGLRLAGDAWYHGVLHKKEYIGDASREITHEDIPRVCRLMTVTAILTLLLSCGVKLSFAL